VYDSSLAARELGWESRYDFRHVLDCLRNGMDFRSPLAREVGSKGYHSEVFKEGPYPVEVGQSDTGRGSPCRIAEGRHDAVATVSRPRKADAAD
jgi:UDP-glucose 4-epimerase